MLDIVVFVGGMIVGGAIIWVGKRPGKKKAKESIEALVASGKMNPDVAALLKRMLGIS